MTCNIKYSTEYWEQSEFKPVTDTSLVLRLVSDYDVINQWIDRSNNSNNGVVLNAIRTKYHASDAFGGGLSFNGSVLSPSVCTIPNSSTLNPTSELTMEVVINPHGYSTTYADGIIEKFVSSKGYGLMIGSAYIRFITSNLGTDEFRIDNTYGVGTPIRISAVKTLTQMKLYINGILQSTQPVVYPGIAPFPESELRIAYNYFNGFYLNADLFEVLIYNRGLTDSEILYNHQHSPLYYITKSIV